MIKRVKVRNFGIFDNSYDYSIDFNKETMIVGPNNSGKSLIFTVINFFRNILETGTANYGSISYRLNSFNDIVHLHNTSNPIEIGLDVETDNTVYNHKIKLYPDNQFGYDIYENKDKKFGFERAQTTNALYGIDFGTNYIKNTWYIAPFRASNPLYPYTTDIANPGQQSNFGIQRLHPSGNNIVQFLLEQKSNTDEKWDEAKQWLQKIDLNMTSIRVPLSGTNVRSQTLRTYGNDKAEINLSMQGSGIQNAVIIISAVIFSPDKCTVCIEEPENFLHPRSQEVLVDLFNHAVNKLGKQIIFSTHSVNILLPFISDIGEGQKRGNQHEKADANNFSAIAVKSDQGSNKIQNIDIKDKKFAVLKKEIKDLLG